MKLWRGILRKRFTFLVVPDSHHEVRKFQLRGYTLAALCAMFLLIAGSALTMLLLRTDDAARISELHDKLAHASDTYSDALTDKEQAIETLQAELLRLSENAATVEQRLAELDQLESELQSIANIALPGEKNAAKAAQAPVSQDDADGHVGGESLPVTESALQSLLDETSVSLDTLMDDTEALQHRLEATASVAQEKLRLLAITPTLWPTTSTRVTSVFGVRRDPFSGKPALHNGIDMAGRTGDPIYAAADGKVIESAYTRSRGQYIVLSHPSGLKSVYMHLRKRHVDPGMQVKQGDEIGELGSTGRSTGPHLHYEIWKNDTPVDPRPYLDTREEE
jgi:murein DD-endopeptidase MepM/ murein hydrolase activator NlpD